MAIDLEHEKLEPVATVFRGLLARNVSPATFWRWRTKGVKGVKLEIVLVGNRPHTTRSAACSFLQAVTEAAAAQSSAEPSSGERTESTTRRLQTAGLA